MCQFRKNHNNCITYATGIRSSIQFQSKRYKTDEYPEPVSERNVSLYSETFYNIYSILVLMATVNFNVLTKRCINLAMTFQALSSLQLVV